MRYLLVVSASPAVKGEAKQRSAVDGISSNTKFNLCVRFIRIWSLYCCALRLKLHLDSNQHLKKNKQKKQPKLTS